jgi:transposase
MNMAKRKFTPQFKTQIVLELLREEKELGAIAAEYEIHPNQIRAWKKEFLDKAARIFEETRQEKEAARREKEQAAEKSDMLKTIGQLTLERDFLKKKSSELFGPDYEKKFCR